MSRAKKGTAERPIYNVGIAPSEQEHTVCPACRGRIVWAADDVQPGRGNNYNTEPDPKGTTRTVFTAVLWYPVTSTGKPSGRQMARIIGPGALEYDGPTWSPHTCVAFEFSKTAQPKQPQPQPGAKP